MSVPKARRRLARIKCVLECIEHLKNNTSLPECLCFVPDMVEFQCTDSSPSPTLETYREPELKSQRTNFNITCVSEAVITASGDEIYVKDGRWIKLRLFKLKDLPFPVKLTDPTWVLIPHPTSERPSIIVPIGSAKSELSKDDNHKPMHIIDTYEELVEHRYSLQLSRNRNVVAKADVTAVNEIRNSPANWTFEHYEELALLLCHQLPADDEQLGSIKKYVKSIDVSSYDDDGASNLTDGDPSTFWESDGSQGQHWIKIYMKKSVIVKKLYITLDGDDDNYLPTEIVVSVGELDSLKAANTVYLNWEISGREDVCVLHDMTEYHPVILVTIKECKGDGIDTRIHAIKIKTTEERNFSFSTELFVKQQLVRYPKLESYSPYILYRRAVLLHRFMTILDSVLPYMVPSWPYSIGSYSSLCAVRQLLLLSHKRSNLVEMFLKESSSGGQPSDMPRLFINRLHAMEHRSDPTSDPEYKRSIFMQIYDGLKASNRDKYCKPLDYRWPRQYEQWWECKFLSEGIIDQGGGFRDSLADLADELCPDKSLLPLPFLIRANGALGNNDVFVPSPSCREFAKYEWIGQLMGACFRSRENLILSLPPFLWKWLSGETMTWRRDYPTVDVVEVKRLLELLAMDREEFASQVKGRKTWSLVSLDGTVVPLRTEANAKRSCDMQNEAEILTLLTEMVQKTVDLDNCGDRTPRSMLLDNPAFPTELTHTDLGSGDGQTDLPSELVKTNNDVLPSEKPETPRTESVSRSEDILASLVTQTSEDPTCPYLEYEEREEYVECVKNFRMTEMTEQLDAIKCGFLMVIPQSVVDLLTWQELERRVCGDPVISLEDLRKTIHYDDLEETDPRVVYLWEALSRFSNEDRSRFLRFVTAKRRLPAPMYVCQGKGESADGLPESSTCGNILYLPSYSSAQVAEEKIRYAAYNCVAIDTDMSPWDE